MPETRIPVAVLGATGSVGQRFVSLLDGHPWFEVAVLTGSERTQGMPYAQACQWVLDVPMPDWAATIELAPSDPSVHHPPLVFSALPSTAARALEAEYARAGSLVCSNASAYRAEPYVPLLLPEVNPDHLALLGAQRVVRGWSGGIVTNPNCTSAGLTVVLKALGDSFGVRRAFAVSMQALSGAGFPGVPSLSVIDNVIPYIEGEEPKVEWEPRKMLGEYADDEIVLSGLAISAQSNRVAVSDGHLVCLSVELDRTATPEQAIEALRAYQAPQASRELPSTPRPVLEVRDEPDRPQPRLDRSAGRGMTTVVGRVRRDPLLDLKMVVLSHNTIRGAAGGSILNAELCVSQNWLKS